jgi:hypothetical protein
MRNVMRKRTINLLLALGVFAAVASFARPPRATEAAAFVTSGRVITRIVGQHQSITVSSTSGGVRYSVFIDGKLLLANATLDEVRLTHPEAFRQIQSAIAHTSPQAWAGVDTMDATDR